MPNKFLPLIILWCLVLLCITNSRAQDSLFTAPPPNKQPSVFSMAAGHQRGFILAHSQSVQNTQGAQPKGLELFFSWQRNDAAVWDLCNCYPRKGLLLNYYNFDNAILGRGYSAAYFLEPTYRLRKNLFFSFRGTFGFSYLTNPFDSVYNPTNQSYSSHLSAYLMVGLGFWLRLNQNWWLNASANYQHISNGGLRRPNGGINWPTVGLALSYQQHSRPYYTGARKQDKYWKTQGLSWEAAVFGMGRRSLDENGIRRRLLLAGLALQASKQVGRIHALNLGAEIYRDEELRVRLKRDSLNASPVKAGILVGHSFLLGRFAFSQRLGIYIFDQTPYYDRLFHRWGVQFNLNRRMGVGFSLKAHRHVADFVDLRLAYSL